MNSNTGNAITILHLEVLFQVYVVQGNLHAARHLLQVPPDGRLVGHAVLVVALVTGVLLALAVFTVSTVLAVMLGSGWGEQFS